MLGVSPPLAGFCAQLTITARPGCGVFSHLPVRVVWGGRACCLVGAFSMGAWAAVCRAFLFVLLFAARMAHGGAAARGVLQKQIRLREVPSFVVSCFISELQIPIALFIITLQYIKYKYIYIWHYFRSRILTSCLLPPRLSHICGTLPELHHVHGPSRASHATPWATASRCVSANDSVASTLQLLILILFNCGPRARGPT